MNCRIVHTNDSFKNTDSFKNEPSDCLQESVNLTHKRFVLKHRFIQERKVLSIWMSNWIIHSNNLFKNTNIISNEASDYLWLSMCESLNHSFSQFVQKSFTDLFIQYNAIMYNYCFSKLIWTHSKTECRNNNKTTEMFWNYYGTIQDLNWNVKGILISV